MKFKLPMMMRALVLVAVLDEPAHGPEPPLGTIFQPAQELMDLALANDMRKVRFKYIRKFLESRASESKDAQTAAQ